MPDELQPFRDARDIDDLPDDLATIFEPFQRAWQQQVPATDKLERFVISLQTNDAPKSQHDDISLEIPAIDSDYANAVRTSSRHLAISKRERRRIYLAPVAAVLIVILGVAILGWNALNRHIETNHPQLGTLLTENTMGIIFQQFSYVKDGDIWAIGNIYKSESSTSQGVILHYINQNWYLVDNTSFLNTNLTDISMLSDTDGWVAGISVAQGTTTAVTYSLYHLVKNHWQQVPVGTSQTTNGYMQVVGPNDIWVLYPSIFTSSNKISKNVYLRHYINGTWQQDITLPDASYSAFYMVDDTEGWFQDDSVIWHYKNGSLNISYKVPETAPAQNLHLTGSSKTTGVWAIQNYYAKGINDVPYTSIIHYDGSKWMVINEPINTLPSSDYYIENFFPDTAQDGWAVLRLYNYLSPQQRYLLHYQNGNWSRLPIPFGVVPQEIWATNSSEAWAIGFSLDYLQTGASSHLPYVLHYHNGIWSTVNP
jgi:hypothetical protein